MNSHLPHDLTQYSTSLNARHLLRQNMNRGIDKTDVELPHFISASSYGPGTVQAVCQG